MFKNIVDYKNFSNIKNNKSLEKKIFKKLKFYVHKKIVQSFSEKYNYAFKSNNLRKYKHFKNINIIGMGGSSLGIKAIYNFFGTKIKKKKVRILLKKIYSKFQNHLKMNKKNLI